MLKDIDFPEVKDVFIAITPNGEGFWDVHIVNQSSERLENVMVSSKGYGKLEDNDVVTSSIRQHVGTIEDSSTRSIESLNEELSKLNNEFWLSFYTKGELFDKKFVFTSESFSKDHFTNIPLLNCEGILHS
jgi:hypothetical protein